VIVRFVDIGGIVDHHALIKKLKYQIVNYKPYIEEGWVIQWSKRQTMICKTLHRKLMDPTKIVYLFNISAFKF
jgi:hypothetical protein